MDRIDDLRIGEHPGARPTVDVFVVGGWGNADAVLTEHGAHRIDTPDKTIRTHPVTLVGADELHNQRRGRSISAAKKADAAFRIPFARLSSATSRLSRRISSLSALAGALAAPGGILFGILSDYYGRVRVLTWTIVLFAVFTGLCAFATGYWDLLVYRTIAGIGLGGEFGQEREWNHDYSIDWHLLQQPKHSGIQNLVFTDKTEHLP